MPEMKTLNGYEIVDAQARRDIESLKTAGIYFFNPNEYEWPSSYAGQIDAPSELAEFAECILSGKKAVLFIAEILSQSIPAFISDPTWAPCAVTVGNSSVTVRRVILPDDTNSTSAKTIQCYSIYSTNTGYKMAKTNTLNVPFYVTNSAMQAAINALREELTGGNT